MYRTIAYLTLLLGLLVINEGNGIGPWHTWQFEVPEHVGEIPTFDASVLLDELVVPEVSGKELAKEAQVFNARWRAHLAEREGMASSLAELAAAFERKGQFAKALALCEKVWEVFPEQQDLIGKIKRDRALGEVEIDLSTPQSAFTSLKRALLTYKLTAATFGLDEPSTILYDPGIPPKPGEVDKETQEIEKRIKQAREEIESAHLHDDPEPAAFQDSTMYLMFADLIDLHVDSATPVQVMKELRGLSAIPLILTPAARTYLEELSSGQQKPRRLSVNLDQLPVHEVLPYLLKSLRPDLKCFAGFFAAHVYHSEHDEPGPLQTMVIEYEPYVMFPDDVRREFDQESTDMFRRLLLDWGLMHSLKDTHTVYCSQFTDMYVVTAPAEVLRFMDQSGMVRIPEHGRYQGRVLPLFRCLRGYPWLHPSADRYAGPKENYLWHTQLDWQKLRMQRFLNDRIGIVMLLRSKLVKAEKRTPNRYIPRFDIPERTIGLTSRFGLWYDGKAYRFLLFDSREDRERWLKGEDWHDMPSDINDYDWEAERQQYLKGFEKCELPGMPCLEEDETK